MPVAERRRKAEKTLAKLKKKGQPIDPVRIEGRTIAKSFWGKSWCTNLERYSDFASRLPRGRSYVRNGSVLDLQIAKGEVKAMVSGSELYTVRVAIAPATTKRWKAICKDCAGSIDSLVELLQGAFRSASWTGCAGRATVCFLRLARLSFPAVAPTGPTCASTSRPCSTASARGSTAAPSSCSSCAASTRTNCSQAPAKDIPLQTPAPAATKVLDDGDVAALFGLEMAAEQAWSDNPTGAKRQRAKTSKGANGRAGTKAAASKKGIERRTRAHRSPRVVAKREGKEPAKTT